MKKRQEIIELMNSDQPVLLHFYTKICTEHKIIQATLREMKKIFTVLILSTLFFGSLAAQDTESYQFKNAIKISPIEFASSTFEISYERYFKNRSHSLLFIPAVILKDDGPESEKGVEAMLQYRFVLTHLKKGINKTMGMYNISFYTGLYANGLIFTEKYQSGYFDELTNDYITKTFEKDIEAAEGGVIIGIQFDITSRILLDFYVGGGIRYAEITDSYKEFMLEEEYYYDSYNVFDKEYTGVKPKVGLQLGFSF